MGAAPDWYASLLALRVEAQWLGCSTLELAQADPAWRRAVQTVMRAEATSKKQRERAWH